MWRWFRSFGRKVAPQLPRSHSSRSRARGFVLPQPAGVRAARGPRAPEHKGDPQPLSSAAALSITSTSKAVACAVISTAGNVTTRPTAQTTTSARAMVWGPAGHAEPSRAAPRPVLLAAAGCSHPHARRPRAAAPEPAAPSPERSSPAPPRARPPARVLGAPPRPPAPPRCTPEVPAVPPAEPECAASRHRHRHAPRLALPLHCVPANHRDPLKRLARHSRHVTARRPPPPSYIRGPAPALRPAGPRGYRRSRPRAGTRSRLARGRPRASGRAPSARPAQRGPGAPGPAVKMAAAGAGWTRCAPPAGKVSGTSSPPRRPVAVRRPNWRESCAQLAQCAGSGNSGRLPSHF